MARTFDTIISTLHDVNSTSKTIKDSKEENGYIEIDAKRQFIESENFDTVIAYEGDINPQIITFKCVSKHESHDLSACANKIPALNVSSWCTS